MQGQAQALPRTDEHDYVDLAQLFQTVKANWRPAAWSFLLAILGGLLVAASISPRYEVHAEILAIQPEELAKFHLPAISVGELLSLNLPDQALLSAAMMEERIEQVAEEVLGVPTNPKRGAHMEARIQTLGTDKARPGVALTLLGPSPDSLVPAANEAVGAIVETIRHQTLTELKAAIDHRLADLEHLEKGGIEHQRELNVQATQAKIKEIEDRRLLLRKNLVIATKSQQFKRDDELRRAFFKSEIAKNRGKRRLAALHNIAVIKRENLIQQYRMAIETAGKLEMEADATEAQRIALSGEATGSELYWRGTKRLTTELRVLESLPVDHNHNQLDKLVEAEAGLDLLEAESEYELAKAMSQGEAEGVEMIHLRASLESLENDWRLATKELRKAEGGSSLSAKHQAALDSNRLALAKLVQAIPNMEVLRYKAVSPSMVLLRDNRRAKVLLASILAGLLLSVMTAFGADFWHNTRPSRQTKVSAFAPASAEAVLQ